MTVWGLANGERNDRVLFAPEAKLLPIVSVRPESGTGAGGPEGRLGLGQKAREQVAAGGVGCRKNVHKKDCRGFSVARMDESSHDSEITVGDGCKTAPKSYFTHMRTTAFLCGILTKAA